jgi:DNA-binding MarR family transcriptional regulator
MTPEGEATAATVNATAADLRKRITTDISSEDIATTLKVVRSLISNIQALSSGEEDR